MKQPAAKKITDHAAMKLNNQLAILRCVRDDGPISRVDLKDKTRLSWGTITSSTRELVDRGVLIEVGAVTTGLGRRPVELELNRARNLVIGMQLGGSLVRSVLMDIKGGVVGELDVPVDSRGSASAILGSILEAGRGILKRHNVDRSALAGIGVAAPGAVDYATGMCYYAPHHPRWKNVPLKQKLEQAFGVPCWVDHAFNCFALGERVFGIGRGVDNYVCVLLGTGVSAGIVLGGEVYRGPESLAGEFGHTCFDEDGPVCACGNRGCFEMYVSGPALARVARERAQKTKGGVLLSLAGNDPSRITAEMMESAARQGDPLSREVFARMGTVLGIGVANLINIFNPQMVILGGLVCRASDFFLPACMETVQKRAWHASPKNVRVSQLQHGTVLGAAALVLQQLFSSGQIVQRSTVRPQIARPGNPKGRIPLPSRSAGRPKAARRRIHA